MFGFGKKGGKGGGSGDGDTPRPPQTPAPATFSGSVGDPTPDEALALLKAGNAAFVRGEGVLERVGATDLEALQMGQKPFAVIVGCADSRTAPTLLFNQGLGRLFIVRVAGNTIEERGLASVIYAVKYLGTPLVVVLGHTGCGAVAAAGAVVDGAELDPALEAMLTPIIPAVLTARTKGTDPVAENARRVANRIRNSETALDEAIDAGKLKVVAAVKDLATGEVRFLD